MTDELLVICKNSNGTCTVTYGQFSETVQIRALTPEKKIQAVRDAILALGLVYSDKIERMVARELFP